jgi:peroxiredoxin
MPPFVLPDQAGRLVAMPRLLAAGPLVVNFHRGHWRPYCRLQRAACQGNPAWMVPVPASFVIGTDGLVVARQVDPD